MPRFAHYIRENQRNEIPSHAIWFDTETTQLDIGDNILEHRLSFGYCAYARRLHDCVYSKPEYVRFESIAEFFDYVESRTRDKTTLYLFCHNTNFDIPVLDLINELPRRGWTLKRAVIDAPPTILSFRKGKRTIKVLDTLNIWRMSLKALGECIGVEKLDMPEGEPGGPAWEEYARQDVTVIMQACLQWWRFLTDHDMGNFSPTLAGQSMSAFVHRFMAHKILAHDRAWVLDLERAAYHGGRTEPFFIGHKAGPLHLLDVASMYPAMMQRWCYPALFMNGYEDPSPSLIEDALQHCCTVAEVLIDTDTPIYPVVMGDRLIFPTGRFMAPLYGPELFEAIVRGHCKGVHRLACYEPAPIFRAFVDHLWNMRQEAKAAGNARQSWQFKILMNSLYGKFGQRGLVWENDGHTEDLSALSWVEKDAHTGEVSRFRRLGGLVQALSMEQEGANSCPAIAGYVTSYARVHLWRIIERAGTGRVFYCDTDSVLVDDTGLANLAEMILPNTLGMLNHEDTFADADIYGPKDYRFGERAKTKGVRKNAIWLDGATVQQEQWSGLKGQLRKGTLGQATTKTITKHLRRVYEKGTVLPSGDVAPPRLGVD